MFFIFSVTTSIIIVGCSPSTPGIVINPKVPNISKPSNVFLCESNSDCTTTIYQEDSCCLLCEYAVNIDAEGYFKEWNNLNCNNLGNRERVYCIRMYEHFGS